MGDMSKLEEIARLTARVTELEQEATELEGMLHNKALDSARIASELTDQLEAAEKRVEELQAALTAEQQKRQEVERERGGLSESCERLQKAARYILEEFTRVKLDAFGIGGHRFERSVYALRTALAPAGKDSGDARSVRPGLAGDSRSLVASEPAECAHYQYKWRYLRDLNRSECTGCRELMPIGLDDANLIVERCNAPEPSATINARPVVRWFAEQMERKLRENDHKGGWENDDPRRLLERVWQEVGELEGAFCREPAAAIVCEATDVANMAMMVADHYRDGGPSKDSGHDVATHRAEPAATVPRGEVLRLVETARLQMSAAEACLADAVELLAKADGGGK